MFNLFKYVHDLVAEAFIPNPNHYTEINHIDENKGNNFYLNLEWCDKKYNSNYGNRNKKVLCIETNISYDSIHNASVSTGMNEGSIGACCRNKQLYTLDNDNNKYHWQFENGNVIGDEV